MTKICYNIPTKKKHYTEALSVVHTDVEEVKGVSGNNNNKH
jgi:hypothetical protein